MTLLINSLLPIFLLIFFGYILRRVHFASEEFWKYLDKFNYFILFPSLLIYKLSTANISSIDQFSYITLTLCTLVLISVLLIIMNIYFQINNSAFTSVYQGAVRFNTYVFLAVIDALLGETALVIAAFLITFAIPFINFLCISIFAWYVPNTKTTLGSFTKSILKNPLILACIIGGGLNLLQIDLPLILNNSLSLLSSAALPLGLISVGVGLHLANILQTKKEIFISSFIKLLFFPFIIFIFGKLLGLGDIYLSVAVLFAAMPTASSAYILAKELGGDTKLISSIISLQTILSIFTIFIVTKLFV